MAKAKTTTPVVEEPKKAELPPSDMYTLQVVEMQYRPDQPQYAGGTKNEYVAIAELVGTKNPDAEDEPFRVWIWGVREVRTLVASFMDKETKKRVSKPSNGFLLLAAMGFDPDPNTKFTSVNWPALEGCYVRAFVGHSDDGKYLKVKASDIKPITDKAMLKHNIDMEDEVFNEG